MFCAAGLRRLEQVLPGSWSQTPLFAGAVGFALLLAAFQGLVDAHISTHFDRYHSQIAETLRKYTLPTDKLIVMGTSSAFSWAGGEDLFRSGRKGLCTYNEQTLKEQ